ncbi:hypothetical protein E4U54_000232 [Claviceps lovelessii]|nr:hypothetical protein E4U54_000232 [Claviceps lovelessii]
METIGIGHSTRRSGAELPFPKKPTTAQDGTSSPRSNIVVAIRPRPNYVPGTGPALQPPRLLPLAASTGYIIERILLPSPGLAADGKPLPKRMTYIVGWRDLPAASLRVPAMDILQYVSLGALEDWEDRLEDEMDEHRQHVDDETQRLGGNDVPSRKTRRRPPAHSAIEQPAAIESESEPEPEPEPEPDVGPHAKSQGMSLSTPKKRKLAEFEGLSDDDDNSPTKQLARELLGNRDGAEHVMPNLVNRHHGKTIITAMDRGLQKEESIDTTEYKLPSTITPVPLPPFITYQSNHGSSGPGASGPNRTVVSLGMDRSSESSHEKEDQVVSSIEGVDTPSNGRPSVALANMNGVAKPLLPARGPSRDQAKRLTSTSQTPTSSVQGRQRSESSNMRKKKQQHRRTLAPSESQTTTNTTNTNTTNTNTTTTQQADDTAWEVERLEDMALYDVENQGLVRYFLVRWVGDWPPEQNPSWEPEDNIPADLVRNYTKMDKKRRAKLAASHQRPPPDPSGWALERRYQSVSEAFGGNVGQNVASTAVVNGDSGSHSLDSEMFVVTDGVQDRSRQVVKETPVPLPPTAFAYWTS